jgi:hypothetical protein
MVYRDQFGAEYPNNQDDADLPHDRGRNFDEVLCIFKTAIGVAAGGRAFLVSTPVNWRPGQERDQRRFGSVFRRRGTHKRYLGFRGPMPYLRYLPQPR